ncbi:MAG: hypothetical protein IKF06_06580 [Lachnospiraceae bacterium]|nr:hypothetical protein [Lachnospiraceae bacterium]
MSEDLTIPVDAHHGPLTETETTCRSVTRAGQPFTRMHMAKAPKAGRKACERQDRRNIGIG